MYFIYQKEINLASKYNYSIESIVNWFIETWDISAILSDLGDTTTPADLVDDIFTNPDCWYDDFARDMNLEQDIIDNMTSDDLCQQIKEVAEDKLLDYYTKHLEELKETLKEE